MRLLTGASHQSQPAVHVRYSLPRASPFVHRHAEVAVRMDWGSASGCANSPANTVEGIFPFGSNPDCSYGVWKPCPSNIRSQNRKPSRPPADWSLAAAVASPRHGRSLSIYRLKYALVLPLSRSKSNAPELLFAYTATPAWAPVFARVTDLDTSGSALEAPSMEGPAPGDTRTSPPETPCQAISSSSSTPTISSTRQHRAKNDR